MNKKQKLIQKLRTGIEPVESFDKFDGDVKKLTQNLRKKVEAESLGTVNDTLENFRNKIDLQPLLDSLEELKNNTSGIQQEVARTLEVKAKELFSSVENTLNSKAESALEAIKVEASNLFPSQVQGMKDDINSFQDSITDDVGKKDKSVRGEISKVLEDLQKIEKEFEEKLSGIKTESGNSSTAVSEIRKEFEKLRTELRTMVNNVGGGGNMNRRIQVEGMDVLRKYTDINLVGATTSITTTTDDTKKRVNIIFTGGGSGGGISSVLAGTGITVDNTTPSTPIVNLGTASVVAGTYGSATTVPRITIDAQGRIQAASTVGITPTPSGGSDTQIQFNDGGVFNGVTRATWNKNASILTFVTPSIASFAQAQHNHQDGTGGGLLNGSSIFSMSGGQIKTSVLGTGTADNTTFLRGDSTWAAPAGGSFTPKFIESTLYETAGRFRTTTGGGGTATFGSPGLSLETISGADGSCAVQWTVLVAGQGSLYTPAFSTICRLITMGSDGQFFFGLAALGIRSLTGGNLIDFNLSHAGFKINWSASGSGALVATQSNGTTETVSGTLATIAVNDRIELFVKMNASSVDYYFRVNDAALSSATNISANFPSGGNIDNLTIMVANRNVDNANAFQFVGSTYERN